MATKKTSTKAKTKTTKAKSKSTKKTGVAKQAKATTPKVTAKAAVAKKAKPSVTVQKLGGLHMLSAGLFLLLAVLAGVLMSNVSYQLTVGHIARDELAGGTLVPAVQAVYDVELRWLVVTALVLSAVMPVLYLTNLRERYTSFVKNTRMQPMRWIDFAVTGAFIVSVVALLSGVSDLPTLKLVGGLVVATGILGLIAERQNNTTAKPVRIAYLTSLLTGFLPWLLITTYAVATVIYAAYAPWYIYALYAAVLGGYVLHVRNQHLALYRPTSNYLMVERNYVVVNLLLKSAFAVILIAGFFR